MKVIIYIDVIGITSRLLVNEADITSLYDSNEQDVIRLDVVWFANNDSGLQDCYQKF